MFSKVLLIEDSRTEALRAKLILEREGFQVGLAMDGNEGLSKAVAEKPGLILLNTLMPRMSGYEVCGKLYLDPRTTDIPILMLASAEELQDIPEGPVRERFLIKPYDPKDFVTKIKQMANGHEPALSKVDSAQSVDVSQLQAELQKVKSEAEAAARTRTDFLANMSHELRTPLHEIIGMTELLSGTTLSSEQQGYLNTVRGSSNALLSLIGDVIEFSEIQSGQFISEDKEFDLNEPIERTVEIMSSRAADKGLDFITAVSPQVPRELIGDAKRLRQILDTLVSNAIKFTERGQVIIRVDLDTLQDDHVDLHFRVSDTGVGIPENRREIVFEPFQQADSTTTRRFGGMGMGLALARQLVTLLGGRIGVESEIGKGSTFHFTFKARIQSKQRQPAIEPAAPAKKWPRPLSILVAEDSPTNQLIAKSSLKKVGHSVAIAANGLEAVKLFEASRAGLAEQRYELVLMDVSMPEMDGLEATRTIREKEKNLGGHIVIVAMTAFATREYHEKCLESGMDAYVTKPVRVDELSKVLEPLMTRQSEPTAAPHADEPMPVVLKEALEVVGDDVDILREAVGMSLEELPAQIAGLKEAMGKQDAKGVESKAHRLKGVMGNVGGLVAREIGQRLETMGEQNNLAGGTEIVNQFEKEIGRVVAFYSDPKWEQLARACQEGGNG